MRFIFRADASQDIGSGHVMRAYAIAEEAISRGLECIFVGSIQGIEWLENRLRGLNFSKILTQENFSSNFHSDVLILDSYTIAPGDPFIQPTRWKKVVTIVDDETPFYVSDLMIHPGVDEFFNHRLRGNFLSGSKFIPLRKAIRKNTRVVTENLDKVIIFGGGIDKYNFAQGLANILTKIDSFGMAIFFSQYKSEIEMLDCRFRVINFGDKLDEEIDNSHLVLTTASTSSLEVVARGIPLGVACSVRNQFNYYETLGRLGIASLIGNRNPLDGWEFNSYEIDKLFTQENYRLEMVKCGDNIIDLDGAKRIVDAMLNLASEK